MLISVEQVESIIRACATEEGFAPDGVPYESTWGPKIVERCRQAAIPSGQVAEDLALVRRGLGNAASFVVAALSRLAAQAQSARHAEAALEQEKDLHRRTMGELDSAHMECETLRDEFAKAAMQGVLASSATRPQFDGLELARNMYRLADSMLMAREEK